MQGFNAGHGGGGYPDPRLFMGPGGGRMRGESWKYHYFSGTTPPIDTNTGLSVPVRTPPAKLREVQIVAGDEGALIVIDDNSSFVVPANFSFKTNCFCDTCCAHTIQITGDTVFWFVAYCQPQGEPGGFPCK